MKSLVKQLLYYNSLKTVDSPADFIVNEVDSKGDVVRLTSFELPFTAQPKKTIDQNEFEEMVNDFYHVILVYLDL